MPAALHPILATEKTAAQLLDMKPAEFRRLVEQGALPKPRRFDRWDVDELRSVASGKAAHGEDGLDL
ncbi:hypothetical protein [Limimaricola cinnabarinus]|uniref:hypothetical protein n=1 Tax=Limimaricola cinnabarinus TaxID=1125964 RepID=UPI00249198E0|nr:hypothetical protein [Limimaricola cinnabarinus]